MESLLRLALTAMLFVGCAFADGVLVKGARKTEKAAKATGDAVKDGANATVDGTKKAAEATGDTLSRGAEATAEGAGKAAKATGKTIKKGADATTEGTGKALESTGSGLSNLGKKLSRKN
jgi:hypothetical protein